MALITLRKDKAVIEDLELGMGVVTQPRGDGTQINGSEIPYSSSESINEAVDRKEDTSSVDSKLALKANLNGSISEVFKSLQGTSNEDVVVLSKLLAELLLKSDIIYVDDKLALKANEDNVLLKDGTSPDFTPVSPNQPSTKKYVDDLIIDVGAGDMLKSIYDLGDTGAVDTSEAIGRFGTLLGQTPMNQVMRLSQSNVVDCNILDDFGIYVGTSVDNAPGSGVILLEQFTISTSKLQRCFVAGTNRWYDRTFNGTIWSGWNELDLTDWVDVQDVPENVSNALSRSGGEMTGDLTVNTAQITVGGTNVPVGSNVHLWFKDGSGINSGLLYSNGTTRDLILQRYDEAGLLNGGLSLVDGGNVIVSAVAPTAIDHLTRKDYVDNANAVQDNAIALNTAKVTGADRVVNNNAYSPITHMTSLTQAQYNALVTKHPTTLYVIVG